MKFLKKIARWIKSLYRRGKDMSFGLQTFDEDGSIEFDSEGEGVLRVVKRVRVTDNTSFTVDIPPPYKFIVLARDTTYKYSGLFVVDEIIVTNSGSRVSVTYVKIGKYSSVKTPATVLVVK